MEEAIKRCNELIKVEHANWIGISNQMAIETVLNHIEELKKYEEYYEEQNEVNAKFINKQVILDKIEELKTKKHTCNAIWEFQREAKIDILQEILKGENNE